MEKTKKNTIQNKDSFLGWLQVRKNKKKAAKEIVEPIVIAVLTATWTYPPDKDGKANDMKRYTTYTCLETEGIRSFTFVGRDAKEHNAFHKVILPWIKGELSNKYLKATAKLWRED